MIDKETAEIIREGDEIEKVVDSEGWKQIKRDLILKLSTFDSISGILKEGRSTTEIGEEVIQREAVVSIVTEWIEEIEGKASKSKFDKQTFTEVRNEELIKTFE